jgi:hypothetical protein
LVEEEQRPPILELLGRDTTMCVWWGSTIECVSAIARRERDGALDAAGAAAAYDRLRAVAESWHEVVASEPLRTTAIRVLRVHPLRAGDALQLAAAVIAADGEPWRLPFVSLDDRLNEAASREGFPVGLD